MGESVNKQVLRPAAENTQPLLLTPGQDLACYVGSLLGRGFLFLITCTSVISVLLIFYFLIRESVPFFTGYSLVEFLTNTEWHPEREQPIFGALALIVGSFYVTIGAMIAAVPVGVMAAIFLSDIVSFRIRAVTKPLIELLAAIPSVAYGFFALVVFNPWLQNQFGFATGTNALNASLILAVMALPTIISVGEDAISATGRELREGSYSLGATRMETLLKVILPAAHSGIIAAIILGMMRAIGETMVVWMASGNAHQIPHPWWDLSQSVSTITATIAGEMGETPHDTMHYWSLFGLAFFVLFLLPLFGGPSAPCILAGALTLAVLALPVMIRASEEAIRAVPQHYKEAALALGANRFRAFVTVTLPAALPGILTAIILSLSRVAGETAPILFTVAVAVGPVPDSIFDPARTLSYGSYDIAVGDRLAQMVPHKQYGMVATLILLVLLLNGVAIYFRGRVSKKLSGR